MSISVRQENTILNGKYRILRAIGQGGFGRTFLAENLSQQNSPRCVIKYFFPAQTGANSSDQAALLFRLEAKRLKELGNHPQVPSLLEYFESAGNQYIAQEFINGQNLEEELAQNGAFTEVEIRSLFQDLLPMLQFVHDHQVIHRDIKPSNIIRRRDRTNVLVDFGAAKYAASETVLARTGTSIGSAEYVAPEQAMGKASFQSDLYSLGVTCIHLLTQIPPFDLMDHSEGRWIWRDFLLQPVSEQLGQILDKLLERGTKRRYQSAAEVLADLEAPKPHLTVSSSTRIISTDLDEERSPLLRTVVAGVCVASVCGVVWVTIVRRPLPIYTPPITVQVPQKPQVHNPSDIKPVPNPRSPGKKATESSKDQVKAIIPTVKSIVQIISFLIVAISVGTGLQKYRCGEDLQGAFSLTLAALMANITMNVMLNLVTLSIEQVITTTPIETSNQLSPSLENSYSPSLNLM